MVSMSVAASRVSGSRSTRSHDARRSGLIGAESAEAVQLGRRGEGVREQRIGHGGDLRSRNARDPAANGRSPAYTAWRAGRYSGVVPK